VGVIAEGEGWGEVTERRRLGGGDIRFEVRCMKYDVWSTMYEV
jgi:hypothetical protein